MKIGNIRVLGDNLADTWQRIHRTYLQPADSYTKLLLHGEGTDASTNIKDASGTNKTVTANGGAQISQVNASGLFDGNSDYLSLADSADWNFGSGDFTIDTYCRFTSTTSNTSICAKFFDADGSRAWGFFLITQTLKFYYSTNGTNLTVISDDSGWSPSLNTWYHLAVIRYGNNLNFYVDGVKKGSTWDMTGVTISSVSTTPLNVAAYQAGAYGFLNGYIDELRISKGIARWTTDFTPQTTRYATDSYTKLLISFDGRDASTLIYDDTGKTITVAGTAQIDTAQYKVTGEKFGSALFFDGTGDYLTVPDSADFNVSSSDFTIDFWVRFNTIAVEQYLFQQYNDGANRFELLFSPTSGLIFYIITATVLRVDLTQGSVSGFSTGVWYHVAVTRKGNDWKLFKDGVIVASVTDADAPLDYSGNVVIGSYQGSASWMNGWIDELRFSKGTARWTAAFSSALPTAAYTGDDPVTSLTISGLNGDVHEEYMLRVRIVNGANAAPFYTLRFNEDSGSNYGYQLLYGNNTTVGALRGTGTSINWGVGYCAVVGDVSQSIAKMYAKSGYIRTTMSEVLGSIGAATMYSLICGGVWNNTTDNITSITVLSDTTNGIGAGSIIELYAKRSKI